MKKIICRERYGPRSLTVIREIFNDEHSGWVANGVPDCLVLKNFLLAGFELYKSERPDLVHCNITFQPSSPRSSFERQWLFEDSMVHICPAETDESLTLTGFMDRAALELSEEFEIPIKIPGNSHYLTSSFDLTRTTAYDVIIEIG